MNVILRTMTCYRIVNIAYNDKIPVVTYYPYAFYYKLIIITFVGALIGGHVNPAVSLTMSILGRLPWRHLPVYMLGQYVGSFLASTVLYAVYYGTYS